MRTEEQRKNSEQDTKATLSTRPAPFADILRGEISAVEAYEQVMEKLDGEAEKTRLREFLADHKMAREYWEQQIQAKGETPVKDSGPWGTFAEAFVGSSKLFGNTAALKAIEEGEEHGLKEYREFIEDDNSTEAQREYVRKVLIPNQERHITSIQAMMKLQ